MPLLCTFVTWKTVALFFKFRISKVARLPPFFFIFSSEQCSKLLHLKLDSVITYQHDIYLSRHGNATGRFFSTHDNIYFSFFGATFCHYYSRIRPRNNSTAHHQINGITLHWWNIGELLSHKNATAPTFRGLFHLFSVILVSGELFSLQHSGWYPSPDYCGLIWPDRFFTAGHYCGVHHDDQCLCYTNQNSIQPHPLFRFYGFFKFNTAKK